MAFQNQAVALVSGTVVGAKGAAQSRPQAVPVSKTGPIVSGAVITGAHTTNLRARQAARPLTQYHAKASSGRAASHFSSGRMRGLGTTSAMVGGGLTFGTPGIPASNTIVRPQPIGPVRGGPGVWRTGPTLSLIHI